MLFFLNNAFADKPIGINGDSINLVVGFAQTTLNNQFHIVN